MRLAFWSGIGTGNDAADHALGLVRPEAKLGGDPSGDVGAGGGPSGDVGAGGGTVTVVGPAVRRRSVAARHPRVRPEAHPDGGHGGLGAVGDAELAEDRREMSLDGVLRQEPRLGDLPVAGALGE